MQSVQLDPAVALSILDHYMRRKEESDRVSGFLLGSTVKNVTQIRGMLPTCDTAAIEPIKRISPKDNVVGWYVTRVDSDDATFETSVLARAITKPIYLSVTIPDDENEATDVEFNCFQLFKMTLTGGSQVLLRKELPVVHRSADPASSVIIDTVVRSQFPDIAKLSDLCALSTSTNSADRVAHLKNILENLTIARKYVDLVLSGGTAGDKRIGRDLVEVVDQLQAISESKKTLDAQAAEGDVLNDALMLQYVAKLLKMQLLAIEKSAARQD